MNDRIIAVQRMQDYIDEHLEDTITTADLARVSHFSPWHSYRLFRELTGLTPAEYIRKLRLTRSALMLKDGKSSVTDAAFSLGYSSVDGYQRAFLKEFGCNPKSYSKDPVPLRLFIPYGVKFLQFRKEVTDMSEVQSVFVQVIKKPEHKVLIKRGIAADDYWSYCEEVGCDIWGLLTSIEGISGEPVCLWLPKMYRAPGTSEYVQGVEVSKEYAGAVPEGFDVITLPEAEYIMFQGEPFREEDYCEAIEALRVSMERYDPSFIGYVWDDLNPRIQLEPRGERGYIELRAVKKKTE